MLISSKNKPNQAFDGSEGGPYTRLARPHPLGPTLAATQNAGVSPASVNMLHHRSYLCVRACVRAGVRAGGRAYSITALHVPMRPWPTVRAQERRHMSHSATYEPTSVTTNCLSSPTTKSYYTTTTTAPATAATAAAAATTTIMTMLILLLSSFPLSLQLLLILVISP